MVLFGFLGFFMQFAVFDNCRNLNLYNNGISYAKACKSLTGVYLSAPNDILSAEFR